MFSQETDDLAGVSKSTVFRALSASAGISNPTRKSIVEIAQLQGYGLNKNARNFQSNSEMTIAEVVSEPTRTEWSFTEPIFLQLLGCMANELDDHGHELLRDNIRMDFDEWIRRHIVRGKIDCAIIIGQGYIHEQIHSIADVPAPIVVWGGRLKDQNLCTAGSGNHLGGALATRHLLALAGVGPSKSTHVWPEPYSAQCRMEVINEHHSQY